MLFNSSRKSNILGEKKKTKYFHEVNFFFFYFTCYLERTNFDVMTTQINILAMEALLGIQCLLKNDSSKKNYLVFFFNTD